ncbi:hypothetical protein C5167_049992 [Papaver somniferum]|uniref:Uncharacterized protein n=1 Tax=Papaver somniferum TaxID=3469 RepID=A0A4Y7KQU3_PAPSO|nr:hypothetical protein C5167_049992 [Papaver somniferum]
MLGVKNIIWAPGNIRRGFFLAYAGSQVISVSFKQKRKKGSGNRKEQRRNEVEIIIFLSAQMRIKEIYIMRSSSA